MRQPEQNLKIVLSYYEALLSKNFDIMAGYLDEEVQFIGPLAEMKGKDSVIVAAKNLSNILKDINVRSKFSSNHEVMLAYDFFFFESKSHLRAAALITLRDNLISKIELFYDGIPFLEKRHKIFEEKKG